MQKFLDIFWNVIVFDKILRKISTIASNSDKFISENGFDKDKFYGFILFYLNTYDFKKFQSLSKK